MTSSEAIKVALDIIEECKNRPNDCIGCPYRVKRGKFTNECMVSEFGRHTFGSPSKWLLNEMLGEYYL